jgi:hypothetical protein
MPEGAICDPVSFFADESLGRFVESKDRGLKKEEVPLN